MTILYFSFQLGSTILHKNFQVIWSNIEGVVVLFVIIILTRISFFYAFKISISILWYLEAKFGYDYFILLFA